MSQGPGKYDDIAQKLQEEHDADGVIVIILNGDRGSGGSFKIDKTLASGLPKLLRDIANEMEEDYHELGIPSCQ